MARTQKNKATSAHLGSLKVAPDASLPHPTDVCSESVGYTTLSTIVKSATARLTSNSLCMRANVPFVPSLRHVSPVLQAKLAKLRRELLEPSTGAGAGGGKGEGQY